MLDKAVAGFMSMIETIDGDVMLISTSGREVTYLWSLLVPRAS